MYLDTRVSIQGSSYIDESLISTETKSYHLTSTSRNHIQQHMEEQVYSTQSRQESINQITKVVNDDAIPTKSSIRYSEEKKRGWKMGWIWKVRRI